MVYRDRCLQMFSLLMGIISRFYNYRNFHPRDTTIHLSNSIDNHESVDFCKVMEKHIVRLLSKTK
nr:matrix metalloproteinase 9 [Dugesia japonica]